MNKLENELYIFINMFAIIERMRGKNKKKIQKWIKMSAFIRLGLMVLLKTGIVKKFIIQDYSLWEFQF